MMKNTRPIDCCAIRLLLGGFGGRSGGRSGDGLGGVLCSTLLMMTLAACTLPPSQPVVVDTLDQPSLIADSSPATESQHQVAAHFVDALRQIPVTEPHATTIELSAHQYDDPFIQAVSKALRRAGYGLRWAEHRGGGASLFQYRHDVQRHATGASTQVFEIAVGDVEMRREFQEQGGWLMPQGPLYVRGADARGLRIDDTMFVPTTGVQLAAIPKPVQAQRQQATSRALQPDLFPTALPDAANPLQGLIPQPKPSTELTLLDVPMVGNVFDRGASNFDDVLAGHTIVAEQVLTFANDSMRLGALNKQLITQLVDRFNPATDVFSVLGCSMGYTRVEGGNAALALGRASRVVEALRYTGVDEARILDEGCWAGQGNIEALPARGVLLTLNREL